MVYTNLAGKANLKGNLFSFEFTNGHIESPTNLSKAATPKAKEASASTAALPSQSGPRASGRGLEPDPRPGTKRTKVGAETIPSTPKRARKAGRD